MDLSLLGPLAALAGTWEGDEGLDVSYSHTREQIIENPFREQTSFEAFGPVDNGKQVLYGLDYRTAAFRKGEDEAFHTEVGYWLWDAAAGQVMRGFAVPRGVMVLAGGDATPDATQLRMSAELGSPTYGILSNRYLDDAAKTIRYELEVDLSGGRFAYEETTVLAMREFPEPMRHTDRNVLHRV